MKFSWKNKKGLTLVELVVCIAVLSLITAAVIGIMTPTINVYNTTNQVSEINTLMDNVSAEIINDLGRATDAGIAGTRLTIHTQSQNVIYDLAGGILVRGTSKLPVLDKRYYKSRSIALSYHKEDGTLITTGQFSAGTMPGTFLIRLSVSTPNSGDYSSRDYAVAPLGLSVK